MDLKLKERVIKRATADARATKLVFNKYSMPVYKITHNPYDRKSLKKAHVLYHNTFYAERKKMKRPVM